MTGAALPSPPAGVRRRVDRLARRAHAFHRFAHHPLCDRYAPELIPLGRRARLCRGCAFTALGAALGTITGALLPACGLPALALAWLALGAARGRRPGKLVTRLVPSAGLAAAASAGLAADRPWLLAPVVASALALWALYRRRGPWRRPCEGCPEYGAAEICSGFRPIARREAAFRRLASSWLSTRRPAPG